MLLSIPGAAGKAAPDVSVTRDVTNAFGGCSATGTICRHVGVEVKWLSLIRPQLVDCWGIVSLRVPKKGGLPEVSVESFLWTFTAIFIQARSWSVSVAMDPRSGPVKAYEAPGTRATTPPPTKPGWVGKRRPHGTCHRPPATMNELLPGEASAITPKARGSGLCTRVHVSPAG